MRVTNRRRWLRTKTQFGFILFITAIVFAGGLEDTGKTTPNAIGFITTMSALALLTINIYRTGDRQ